MARRRIHEFKRGPLFVPYLFMGAYLLYAAFMDYQYWYGTMIATAGVLVYDTIWYTYIFAPFAVIFGMLICLWRRGQRSGWNTRRMRDNLIIVLLSGTVSFVAPLAELPHFYKRITMLSLVLCWFLLTVHSSSHRHTADTPRPLPST